MNIKITPTKLHGTIKAMPSKSHAHRVLIARRLAQLQRYSNTGSATNPKATIREHYLNEHSLEEIPSFSQDIEATKNCLAQLDKTMPYLDCKESGSTLRFMLPVTMALKDEAVFMGTGKLPYRPLSPLKEEMELHGCNFTTSSNTHSRKDKYKEICTVRGRLQPGNYRLAGNISSQFITGLLMALPLLDGDSTLELVTSLESAGYVDLTLDVLRDFNINIVQKTSSQGFNIYEIKGNQQYVAPDRIPIQCDWSNAAFWLACGAIGGDITLTDLDMTSSQRDKEFVYILERMGADITVLTDDDSATSIRCTGNKLSSAEINVSQIPDLVPVLSVVMSAAKGASMITNAQRLKIKESDRLYTVFDLLSRLGADITDGGSGLSITGSDALNGGDVSGHNDHRIVMAAAVASCICQFPVTITGAEAVNKSYPAFFEDFVALGGKIQEV